MKLSEFTKNFKDEERDDNLINKNGFSEKSEKNAEKLRNFQKNEAFNGDFYANSNFQSEKNVYRFQSENDTRENENGAYLHFKSERQSDANFEKDFNHRGVNFDAEKETLNKRYDEIKNLPYEDLLLQFKNEVQKQKDAGEFDYDALRTSVEAVKMFVPNETYENMRRLLDEIED